MNAVPAQPQLVTIDDLQPLLASRRWRWRTSPFPHVVAENVFAADVYQQLAVDYRALLNDAGYNSKHDFFGSSLFPGQCGSLELFLSRAWYTLFTKLFNAEEPGFLTAGVHRHRPGSRNGFPHNDIYPEPVRSRPPGTDMINFGDRSEQAVRAVAILFYLNNGPWSPGDGGETGLYWDWKDPVSEPAESVPPRDNTLLAFGCNPHAYHSFLSNRKRRDSVISFVYRGLGNYLTLWAEEGVRQYAEYGRHHA